LKKLEEYILKEKERIDSNKRENNRIVFKLIKFTYEFLDRVEYYIFIKKS
jgi:hypothetical protein